MINENTANYSTFIIVSLVVRALNSVISTIFTGSSSLEVFGLGSTFSSDVIHALYNTKDYSTRVNNLATLITNSIRQQEDSESGPFSGLAFKTETYVRARWAWFAYPATVIVLSLLYLVRKFQIIFSYSLSDKLRFGSLHPK